MKRFFHSVASLAAGAVAMYYLDPEMGRRRRAVLRDKLRSGQRNAQRFARSQSRRAADKARGAISELREVRDGHAPATDEQLAARVRSELGRLSTRPGAIDVAAQAGHVSLHGHVLAAEHTPLVQTISAMNGVQDVDDCLVVHDRPGNIPELQGEERRPS